MQVGGPIGAVIGGVSAARLLVASLLVGGRESRVSSRFARRETDRDGESLELLLDTRLKVAPL